MQKANRAVKEKKNGCKTKIGNSLKAKKNLVLNFIENPVSSTSSANKERQYSQSANNRMMKIGSSVETD